MKAPAVVAATMAATKMSATTGQPVSIIDSCGPVQTKDSQVTVVEFIAVVTAGKVQVAVMPSLFHSADKGGPMRREYFQKYWWYIQRTSRDG